MPSLFPVIVDSPLAFGIDPGTGLLSVVAIGTMQQQGAQKIAVPAFSMSIILHLTTETVRKLLSDLPALQRLLEQASEGPTKPRYEQ